MSASRGGTASVADNDLARQVMFMVVALTLGACVELDVGVDVLRERAFDLVNTAFVVGVVTYVVYTALRRTLPDAPEMLASLTWVGTTMLFPIMVGFHAYGVPSARFTIVVLACAVITGCLGVILALAERAVHVREAAPNALFSILTVSLYYPVAGITCQHLLGLPHPPRIVSMFGVVLCLIVCVFVISMSVRWCLFLLRNGIGCAACYAAGGAAWLACCCAAYALTVADADPAAMGLPSSLRGQLITPLLAVDVAAVAAMFWASLSLGRAVLLERE